MKRHEFLKIEINLKRRREELVAVLQRKRAGLDRRLKTGRKPGTLAKMAA